MEQTKALNALEPFVALTKSATSARAAADLVTRATSHPNAYLFTELLETTQIQALASSEEHSASLTLLRIFSHGTLELYRSTPGLPALNDAQLLKLRQLSLLTLARDRSDLGYARLQEALDLPGHPRALEDLVVSAVYAGLLDATLNPARKAVQVNSVSPLRDLAPDAIPPMAAALRSWSDRCAEALGDLEARMAGIQSGAARRQREKAAWEAKLAKLVAESENGPQPAAAGAGAAAGGATSASATAAAADALIGAMGTAADKKLGGSAGGLASGASQRMTLGRGPRFGKRGPGLMEASEDVDEAMDVDDDEDDVDGKKRASRRKL